jgi:hypothetical protein
MRIDITALAEQIARADEASSILRLIAWRLHRADAHLEIRINKPDGITLDDLLKRINDWEARERTVDGPPPGW